MVEGQESYADTANEQALPIPFEDRIRSPRLPKHLSNYAFPQEQGFPQVLDQGHRVPPQDNAPPSDNANKLYTKGQRGQRGADGLPGPKGNPGVPGANGKDPLTTHTQPPTTFGVKL